jgi:rod shape-determining protein MreB and related proteins
MQPRTYKRRTRSFWRFQTLRDMVSDSMAIDMGSANTVVSVRGRGVVVDEPSVVAVNKATGELVAVGREAAEMQGREAREVSLVWPVADGVVADFDHTQKMLAHFVTSARSGFSHFSRRAVMSVLSGVTHVEHRALLSAAESAHIGRVYMVEEGLAAAIGAGVDVEDKHASAVVDVGGDSTNVAVVALGMIVYSRAERMGSRDIDSAISERLRRFRGLRVGPATAERLKFELGSAVEPADPARSVSVRGRDVTTGRPGALEVTADEISAIARPVLDKIAEAVRAALADLPPEVAADIYDRGIILTGGGVLLEGLPEFLRRETGLATRVADDPRYACVKGLTQLFDEPLLLRRVTRSEPSLLLDSEAAALELP